MFHACVQRFDEIDEKILGRELNRAFVRRRVREPGPSRRIRDRLAGGITGGLGQADLDEENRWVQCCGSKERPMTP